MDAQTIQALISSLGFPIVACGALGWYIVKRDKEHAEQIAKFVDALDKNTDAINAITAKM